jgi:preprotein translocase subunit SecG
MPRWVKLFLIVTVVVVLLLILLLLTSGGHGPGRHIVGGGVGGPADASEAVRTVEVTTLYIT